MFLVRVCFAALVGLVAAAAVLAHGGRWSGSLDILTSFAAVYMVVGAAALGVGAANPRWRERRHLVSIGALIVISATALMVPELMAVRLPEVRADDSGDRLKIVQLNLNSDGDWNGRVVDWLVEEGPDVVILQDLGPRLKALIDQRLPLYHVSCANDCRIAMLSRELPVRVERWQGGAYGLIPRTIVAEFDIAGRRFPVVGTHLARPYRKGPSSPNTSVYAQSKQAEQLRKILGAADKESLILAGDFNSTPWSFARQYEDKAIGLERRTRFLFSWPANLTGIALLPIDHVYAGAVWRTEGVRRGPYLGSDHYPVVAVLVWRDPPH
jgi:endonuclease/exonuclease/phosphatase (EEP) superfamily protein YafD